MNTYKSEGSQDETNPASTGIVAIFAYDKLCGMSIRPTVMPAMASLTSQCQS
jgi:hypothetical protein